MCADLAQYLLEKCGKLVFLLYLLQFEILRYLYAVLVEIALLVKSQLYMAMVLRVVTLILAYLFVFELDLKLV